MITGVNKRLLLLIIVIFFSGLIYAQEEKRCLSLEETCIKISGKLASVDLKDCTYGGLIKSNACSSENVPILVKEYPPLENRKPQSRVLVIGGIHGDEYASISVAFKWMQTLDVHHSGLFHWIFIPLLNPDGLFTESPTRTNARGVDLNRNLPGPLWQEVAFKRWTENARENPRYYPGSYPMSEPETVFLVRLITEFRPDAIISLHSPLDLVDFDGPGEPPSSIGGLGLRRLGNFSGTLGNFAGNNLNIPVLTIELASSGRMPSSADISSMWRDIVRWLTLNTPVQDTPELLYAGEELEFTEEFFGQ